MRFTVGLVVSVSLLGAMQALAEPYQWELEGQYDKNDYGFLNYTSSEDAYAASAKYYIDPVSTKGHPLAEAAFLERASNLSLSLRHGLYDSSNSWPCPSGSNCQASYRESESSHTQTGIGAEYYVPNSIFYVSGHVTLNDRSYEYRRSSDSGEEHTTHDSESTFWSAAVGIMPLDGWLIATGFGGGNELIEGDLNLNSKYVLPLGSQALNVTANYSFHSNTDHWKIGGDYYFTPTFSVGGSYADNDIYGVRAEKFFGKSLSLSLSYEEDDYHESYSASLKARF